MKVKATKALHMTNKAVGIAGAPRLLRAGAELDVSADTLKHLQALFGEDAFEKVGAPPPADATREAPDKPDRSKKGKE